MITAATTTAALAQLSDTSSFPSPAADGSLVLGLTPRRITGATVVCEWVARSWLTPRRGLVYATSLGVDLRDLYNATLDAGELQGWRQSLSAEARKRPFVQSCAIALARANRITTVDARLILVDGKSYPLMVTLAEAAKVIVTLPT